MDVKDFARVLTGALTNDEIRDLARVVLSAHLGILGAKWPKGTPRDRMRDMLERECGAEAHLDEVVRIIDHARKVRRMKA